MTKASTGPHAGGARRRLAAALTMLGVLLVVPAGAGAQTGQSPASGPAAAVRLVVAGDVGTGSADAYATAGLAADLSAEEPFDALILLGDNAYPNGDPARLPATVFEPFGPVLDGGAALLAVLGNHDVKDGNGDAHAAVLGMPNRWYSRRIGPVLFIGLDSTRVEDRAQVDWLDGVLAATDATWKIAAMHHPPYSAGWHRSELSVRSAFTGLFERYGVQLVLAGHDHDYQRSLPIGGVTYVVSGGGSSVRPTGRAPFTAESASVLHILEVSVSARHMTIRAVGHDGVLDEAVIYAHAGGTRCARLAVPLVAFTSLDGGAARHLGSRTACGHVMV